jgi:dipeptidyl aminopeptidase/acylaminoacyl peptidase
MWDKLVSFHPNRDPSISSRSYDSKTWIITYTADNATTAMYLYKPGTWPPQLLLEMQPELNKFDMANMHTVVIPARDGLMLPAYLTLPRKPGVPTVLPACVVGNVPDLRPSAKEAIDSSPLKCPLDIKVPLVLYVHGGPWARDTWGADSIVQFLANRGYAVLQVNFRGSTSYGRNFSNVGNREWGVGKMQHDLTDSVRWAIEKGIADPSKVCIWGASYGGYATLAGLAFTPQLYACGVDLVGVSNVATFLKSIPPYWKPLRIDFVNRVGDAEANATLNQEISPVFHARNIQAPLLIGQGMNDPRVAKAESDQMFRAMKSKGLDVEYIMYPDEGHGLVRPDNRLDFYSRMEQFLAKHLGGRAAPLLKPPG